MDGRAHFGTWPVDVITFAALELRDVYRAIEQHRQGLRRAPGSAPAAGRFEAQNMSQYPHSLSLEGVAYFARQRVI